MAAVTRTPRSEAVLLWRRLAAEFLGSGFLAAVVIGSGIAAQRLSPGDTGLELLENAAATAAGLFAIIVMFGPVSGGHFNPVVSFADAAFGGLRWRDAAAYLPAQVAGCVAGAVAANLMFTQAVVSISVKHRASGAHFLSEVIATFGLILVIFALARSGRSRSAPAAVGAYIGAAYFFTSSASFANPAISIGRMFSDSFAGIAPSSVPAFIAAQVIGGIAGALIIKALYPGITAAEAAGVIVPHEEEGVASATAEGAASATAEGAASATADVAAPAGMAARQPGPPVQATAGDRAVSGPAPGGPGGPRGADG
jgi:glycerol uptake facilitator-like aquaporin